MKYTRKRFDEEDNIYDLEDFLIECPFFDNIEGKQKIILKWRGKTWTFNSRNINGFQAWELEEIAQEIIEEIGQEIGGVIFYYSGTSTVDKSWILYKISGISEIFLIDEEGIVMVFDDVYEAVDSSLEMIVERYGEDYLEEEGEDWKFIGEMQDVYEKRF